MNTWNRRVTAPVLGAVVALLVTIFGGQPAHAHPTPPAEAETAPAPEQLAPPWPESWPRWSVFDDPLEDPFATLARMRAEMDRIFGEGLLPARASSGFRPAMDLNETDDAYVIRVDLPGVEQGRTAVRLEGQRLTIKGERVAETKRTEEGGAHLIERQLGACSA